MSIVVVASNWGQCLIPGKWRSASTELTCFVCFLDANKVIQFFDAALAHKRHVMERGGPTREKWLRSSILRPDSSQDLYSCLSRALRVERQSDDARHLRKLRKKPGQACAAEVDIPSQISRGGTTMSMSRVTGHETVETALREQLSARFRLTEFKAHISFGLPFRPLKSSGFV